MDNVTRLLMQGAAVAAGGVTYVDDLFSTYLWRGNETARTIPSGVDNTKGGLVWVKARNDSAPHQFVDTVRGANKILFNPANSAESTIANRITGFTNNGFNVGSAGQVNGTNAYKYAGWNFRKAKGFFDIVTWTGNGVDGRQISHDLGCVPGFVMIKCTSDTENWACYHRDWTGKVFELDTTSVGNSGIWKNTTATDTYISVNAQGKVNGNGKTYVGYFFAGGASTAANARAVDFNGSSYLDIADHSDFTFGTDDFTYQCWIYPVSCTQDVGIPDPRPASTNNVSCMYGFNSSLQLLSLIHI